MKILIVGGTGLIGGHAALHLRSKGHSITLASRNLDRIAPILKDLPCIQGNYIDGSITEQDLAGFDAVVFAAGSDVRHVPAGVDADEHFLHVNGEKVPEFARRARDAGVKQFVHIGSFYPHVCPDLIETSAYVRSRHLAATRFAELSRSGFSACSIDAPYMIGTVPTLDVPMAKAHVMYAQGKLGIPPFVPSGGVNYMSVRSLSEAIAGALEHPKEVAGKTMLVGDQNLSYQQYFEKVFRAVGNDADVPIRKDEHPLMPSATLYAGDRQISYEPTAEDLKTLGEYTRHDIGAAIEEMVVQFG